MNTIKLFWNNSLYIVLPILFCIIMHFLFTYAIWDINPQNWPIEMRIGETFVLMLVAIYGILFSNEIYTKKQNG